MDSEEQEKISYEEDDNDEASPLPPKAIETFRRELEQCQKEKEEYLAGWQRCQADAVNVRKEYEKQRVELSRFALQDIVSDIVYVLNTFHHAFFGKDENDPHMRGFRHIYQQLLSLMQRYGVELIEAEGKPFDGLLYEAIENISVSEKEKDNIVLEEIEKGYMLHGKVIRPSKVKVGVYHTPTEKL